MSSQCIGCERFTVKDRLQNSQGDKDMRALGFGRCTVDKQPGHYVAATAYRHCDTYRALPPDQVERRRTTLAKFQA